MHRLGAGGVKQSQTSQDWIGLLWNILLTGLPRPASRYTPEGDIRKSHSLEDLALKLCVLHRWYWNTSVAHCLRTHPSHPSLPPSPSSSIPHTHTCLNSHLSSIPVLVSPYTHTSHLHPSHPHSTSSSPSHLHPSHPHSTSSHPHTSIPHTLSISSLTPLSLTPSQYISHPHTSIPHTLTVLHLTLIPPSLTSSQLTSASSSQLTLSLTLTTSSLTPSQFTPFNLNSLVHHFNCSVELIHILWRCQVFSLCSTYEPCL